MARDPGLLVNFGLTEKEYMRQLARMESATIRKANQIERQAGRATRTMSRGFDDAARSATRFGTNGLRQVSLQLNQVAQQGAVTGDYLRALSIQMPDILLAFGTFGALAGVAAGALIPFVAGLFDSAEAANEAADAIQTMNSQAKGIESQLKDLTDLQERLNEALRAQGDASAAGAAAVIANTRAEIAARKQRLAVELQILAVNRRDAETQLQNLRQQQQTAAAIADATIADLAATGRAPDGSPGTDPRDPANLVRGSADFDELQRRAREVLGPDVLAAGKERQKDILDLQIALFELDEAARQAGLTIEQVFEGGEVTGTQGGGGSRGGGGRSGSSSPAEAKVQTLTEATKELAKANEQLASSAERAFVSFVTGAQSAQSAARSLLGDLAQLFAQAAFRNVLGATGGLGAIGGLLTTPSFAGGGFTGMGARAGGMDGKGGFPAILHPNETVIDHTRGQSGGGISLVVNIDAKGARDSGSGAVAAIPQLKSAVVAAMQDAQRRGYR